MLRLCKASTISPPYPKELMPSRKESEINPHDIKDRFYDPSRDVYCFVLYTDSPATPGRKIHAINEHAQHNLDGCLPSCENSYIFLEKTKQLFFVENQEKTEIYIEDKRQFLNKFYAIMRKDQIYSTRHFTFQELEDLKILNNSEELMTSIALKGFTA